MGGGAWGKAVDVMEPPAARYAGKGAARWRKSLALIANVDVPIFAAQTRRAENRYWRRHRSRAEK